MDNELKHQTSSSSNNINITPPVTAFNSEILHKTSTSSSIQTSSIINLSPNNASKHQRLLKRNKLLISNPNKMPLLKSKIARIIQELSPKKKESSSKWSRLHLSSSQRKQSPSLLFRKTRESFNHASSSFLHKGDLSLEMSQNFILGTLEKNIKQPFRFSNYTQIRNKLINDFTVANKPSSNELSK